MRTLKWTISHAVFVTEIDDEHKEIFEALAGVQEALAAGIDRSGLRKALEGLTTNIVDHFKHEERLMRAARYNGLRWHRQLHDAARLRVQGLVLRIQGGDPRAGAELVSYLTSWLHDHTRVADRMMGAAIRNHSRCVWKLTFHAGTKPLDSREWVTVDGDPFRPPTPESAL
jgi:hemerythrin-like metal-binding protein